VSTCNHDNAVNLVCIQSYVGNVLLRVSHPTISSSQFLPLFCSSIIEGVAQVPQNQCVVVYGAQSTGKRRLIMDALCDVLLHLDDPCGRASSITSVGELLNFFSSSHEDYQSRCVTITTLLVDPATNSLKGALYSLALLDTSQLARMQVKSARACSSCRYCSLCCAGVQREERNSASGRSLAEAGHGP